MNLKGKKVFVGLSGGVDSAVSALLLKLRGAEVTGVFIKGWYPPKLVCSWKEDRKDAMRVAAYLRIPFLTLDASVEYKRSVLEYLVQEYKAGRTPNPDVMCNKEVKFGAFFRFARSHNADFIATGHYACIESVNKTPTLKRHKDSSKDQSYFLWALSKEVLPFVLFPLSGISKKVTRLIASISGIPVALKKDSQGICFLGSLSLDDFLRSELPHKRGVVIDTEGNVIGEHDGVLLYTIGERIALSGKHVPYFVVSKDLSNNTLTAHTNMIPATSSSQCQLTQTNYFADVESFGDLIAQYRYHGPYVAGRMASPTLFLSDAPLKEPMVKGQSLVLYKNDYCVGGGILQ